MKKIKINKKFGVWEYEKQLDREDEHNYMYYFNGIDADGECWSWSTCYYHEIFIFIKSSKKEKQIMIRNY